MRDATAHLFVTRRRCRRPSTEYPIGYAAKLFATTLFFRGAL
ncbi:MAG TPA: hypothetical protein VIK41_02360 [Gemmatimonadaceae bacterium]